MQKHYTGKQKAQIVLEMCKEEKTVTQISSEYGVHYRYKVNLSLYAYSGEIVHRFRLMPAIKERSRTVKIIINQLADMGTEERSLL